MTNPQFDSVSILKADRLKPKLERLSKLIAKEKGVKVPIYATVRIAVEEALERRGEAKP